MPILCQLGTYQDEEATADACKPCAAGTFCGSAGLTTEAGSGPCQAGFFCKEGAKVAAPRDKSTGDICKKGHHCPSGSKAPQACPSGYYSDEEGLATCKPCPAGSLCPGGTNGEIGGCPAGSFCKAAVPAAAACPDGTTSEVESLAEEGQCADCPAGKVCEAGKPPASCPEGFLCLAGVGPKHIGASNADIDELWLDSTFWGGHAIHYGGACPPGHFCPRGATAPEPCAQGTVREQTGGKSQADCTKCPIGSFCDPRMPVPVSCPPGYYCPEDTQEPSPCEAGSYLTASGHSEKSACTICPEGYACNRDGVVDYKLFPCPTGYFCGAGVLEPEACPAGTYGAAPKLTRADLCEACPPGIVCTTRDEEDGSRRPQALGCPAGYVCPKSTSTPTLCPAGTFCPRGTSTPRTCPAGYFCPEGAETPVLCSKGTFCLEGATEPSVCPAGYKAKDSCVGAYSVEACCEPCPVATYSDRPGATHCSPCAAGYICKGGATTAKPSAEETSSEGYVCPPGYYCLEGASEPTPCPAGTFRDQPGGEALDGCSPCPHGTFQRFPGMASCTKCGEHAVSEKSVGSTTCTCLGISRFYQIEDGTCPCYARSSPQGGEPQESQDGRSPCEAKLYPRCASGSHRDDFGACVFEAEVECGESCRGGSGSFLAAFGVCQCADGPRIAAQCTSTCKEQLPQVFVSDAGFEEIDSVQGSKTVYSEGLPPDIDLAHLQFLCNKLKEGLRGLPLTSLCGVSFHQASSAGLDGLLRMPEEFRPAHGSRNYEDSQDTFAGTQAQLRRSISSASFKRPGSRQRATDPRHVVPRPVQCLQRGSTIIWELKDGVYPVYHKESLMNTHPAMDDGPFRELAQTAPILPQFFAYTFLVAGSFVFAASDNPLEIAVVVVVPDGVRCPAASTFAAPLSTQSLGILGVTTASQRLMTEPNWGVVFLGVFAVAACCLLAFYAVWRCRHSAWEVRVWTAPLGSANRIPNDDFKSVLAALDGLPGATGNLRCTDTRLVHHVVLKPAEPLLETTGKTTSPSDDAPIIPLKDAADALVVDIESTDTRLLQVMFEKLLDFGNILKRLVEDEVKAVKAACDVMPQTLERILRRTRQTLLLLPNEHMWAISPSQAKLLQALACVFTEGDNSPAVGEALANALTPHTLESSQVSKGGDLPGSLLACVDLAGVAVFDAFDCLWLLEPQHGEDSVADRVLGKLEKLLEGNDPLEENSDSLFVIYDTLFAERAYQEERLRRECTRVQSRFAGVMQKFKDTCQTLHLLPAKQAQAWFELKDFQLRELLDFEAKASRSIVEAAVGGVRSGKAMLNDNLLTTTLEMDPSNSRAFLSGILASSRKTLLDQIRQQLAAALKEMKQLLKRQDAALMELLSEHARSYRTAAEARRRACRALLQQKHTEEKQRLKRWSATMVKAVKETRSVPAEMQGNAREEQERLDMETALEQVHRATAHRRQLGEDRQRLENQMADAAFSTAVDLHEAHLDFLRDQTRMEYQLLEASSREDHEIHSDFAVELGTLQLEALVMSVMKRAARQEANDQCETTLDEVLETEMEGCNGQTVVTALQAVQSKVTKQQSASREISASLVAKGKQASEALTRCVANRYDLMTQAIDQIQGKSFQLALSALEAREDTWKAALSAAGRLALNDAERQTSEKEVLRQLEVQKTVEADDEFEKTQLLQELLEKNCHTRLRTVTQLRRAMLQTRLKAWAAVALHGGFFDKVKALQSWKEVADHRSQEDDALAAIRDQRRQAMGKYVMRVRKLVIREEKRRVHQKESLAHAAFVVTQPRTVTGKALGTAGGVLQGAVEMLAHKKLDDEFTRRRSALKAELRRELEAIDEEIKRHQEIIEAEAEDLSGADDEVPQETVSMGGSVSELGNAEGGQSVRKKRNSEMGNRLSLLDRQRAEIVNLFNENERQLESEWRTRAVHVRHEILQKITDFAVELESSGQQLDSIAAEVARDVTVQYQEELKELEGTRDAPVAEQDNTDGFEEDNKDADAAPPEGDLDQKLRHLAMVRCQRVILRLKRLVEKGSKMARSLSEEASAELRRLQKEEREKEAERRVELERELQQHEREKVEAEKRLAESLESLQREWEERLERTQEEGRARLRELQEAARREAGRKVGDQNLGAIKQEIFTRHQEDATRFDEALGAEYWKQMNRLRERLQVKMMARKRRLAAAAQEQLSIEGDRLKEARNAFVAQQESISFYDPDKQREVVLRIGRAWRDEARRRTAQKKANAEADQIATEDAEPLADLPPLQKLSTSVLNKRLAGMRRAIEDTIAEMHGTMQSISTTDGRRSTSSRPTIHQFESLVDATGQISQLLQNLEKLSGVYSSIMHN
uniref:GCC2 and GCC3 domain-containing protein n=1 Tax=Toxoplasma gondii COUG TaxID=1074873 RepID=A0A2G8XSI6_TOXGO|nr:GCC2 and GCC3 domain-containing protein [Toxoplasma gondii COUG]